jgi:DNA-binding response OmpR family regulator
VSAPSKSDKGPKGGAPRAPEAPSGGNGSRPPALPPDAVPGSTRILVITDNKDEGAVAESLLEHAGYAVGLVSNRDVTIEQIEVGMPGLIVMDTLTPRLSDWPILPQLAQRGDSPPIVVLSSNCLSAQMLGSINEFAADHLAKPLEADTLVGRCTRLMKRRPR